MNKKVKIGIGVSAVLLGVLAFTKFGKRTTNKVLVKSGVKKLPNAYNNSKECVAAGYGWGGSGIVAACFDPNSKSVFGGWNIRSTENNPIVAKKYTTTKTPEQVALCRSQLTDSSSYNDRIQCASNVPY